jgi:hypothetical protein
MEREGGEGRISFMKRGPPTIFSIVLGLRRAAQYGPVRKMPGFGADLKKSVKQRYLALVALNPYGETRSRPENRITGALRIIRLRK